MLKIGEATDDSNHFRQQACLKFSPIRSGHFTLVDIGTTPAMWKALAVYTIYEQLVQGKELENHCEVISFVPSQFTRRTRNQINA